VQPLFELVPPDAIDRGADAFAAAVERLGGDDGVEITALLGVGAVPLNHKGT
jgi:hypothetical protein